MDVETECERLVERLADRGSLQRESTAEALRPVPRHEFVPAAKRDQASHDRPLPIGAGQTISAPHMVAMMVDELDLELGDRVLEIGTGCGYHAAVTAEVVGDGNVYSVEYVAALADRASETLGRLGYEVAVRVGDGREGWPEHAPYDAALSHLCGRRTASGGARPVPRWRHLSRPHRTSSPAARPVDRSGRHSRAGDVRGRPRRQDAGLAAEPPPFLPSSPNRLAHADCW